MGWSELSDAKYVVCHDAIPVCGFWIYFKKGIAKVEIALARGKKAYDKRDDTKAREAKRDMDRAMKAKNR